MSVNGITNVMTPTVQCDASGDMGDVTFGCEWKTTYNGQEAFKFMDCVFFLNGQQTFSDAGQGDMDSDTFKVARRTLFWSSDILTGNQTVPVLQDIRQGFGAVTF